MIEGGGPIEPWPPAYAASAAILLETVIETSNDAVLICGAQRRIASWGTTATRLFGHVPDDVVGRPLDELFPEHLRSALRVMESRLKAGDEIRHFETEMSRADGMPMPVSLSITPVLDDAQCQVGSVVIIRDVTEQVLAQATLAEVETRLQEGEALAHVGSWLWDRRTGAVQWSAEFHRLHGVDPLDFEGTLPSFLDAVHSDDRARVRAALEGSVESCRPVEVRYRTSGLASASPLILIRAQPTIGSARTVVGLRGVGQAVAR